MNQDWENRIGNEIEKKKEKEGGRKEIIFSVDAKQGIQGSFRQEVRGEKW